MASWKFTVKRNKNAQRCEICHKSDLFDPGTGICQRCQPLPIEQLASSDMYSIRAIPPSQVASTIATIFACLSLIAGLISMHLFFLPHRTFFWYTSNNLAYYLTIFLVNFFNLPLSIAIHRWCSDQYNERLAYRVIVWGRICSVIGLGGSGIGFFLSVPRLLNMLPHS